MDTNKLPPHLQESVDYVNKLVKKVSSKHNISETKARELVGRVGDYSVSTEADVHTLIKGWIKK